MPRARTPRTKHDLNRADSRKATWGGEGKRRAAAYQMHDMFYNKRKYTGQNCPTRGEPTKIKLKYSYEEVAIAFNTNEDEAKQMIEWARRNPPYHVIVKKE